jgi:hypothetical protein
VVRFAIGQLREDQLLDAWPVVRMANVHANSEWWIDEAAALMKRGGGVLAARAPNGTIYGVATYEVAKRAPLGRVLAVDILITFELSRRAPARKSLTKALELLASAFDCRGIVLPLATNVRYARRSDDQAARA